MTLADEGYLIESLGSQHDRAAFCCGIEALDRYLQKQAGQDARKYVAAPYVLFDKVSHAVIGYYTLSSTGIITKDLPTEITKKLTRYDIVPATLLGRLAIDKNYQGKRLGEVLLIDALHRSFLNRTTIASIAVIVDAKNDKACSFYQRYNFICFPNQSSRLFLMMATISKMFE